MSSEAAVICNIQNSAVKYCTVQCQKFSSAAGIWAVGAEGPLAWLPTTVTTGTAVVLWCCVLWYTALLLVLQLVRMKAGTPVIGIGQVHL